MSDRPIPRDEYGIIANHVPIVSVDLLVHHDWGLLLGKRQNEPAKGEWFVPGGSMLKSEDRRQAVHRVAREELGSDVTIEQKLGVYDHFYETAEVDGVQSKQYLATAYIVTPNRSSFHPDSQHTEFQVFYRPFEDFHDYVHRYINDLQALGYSYA